MTTRDPSRKSLPTLDKRRRQIGKRTELERQNNLHLGFRPSMCQPNCHLPKLTQLSRAAVLALLLSGCDQSATEDAPLEWRSRHLPVDLDYSPPWTLITPSQDSQHRVVVGLIDQNDGKSYVIKVDADVPQSEVSDSAYFDAVKEQMTTHRAGNTLVDERDVELHGAIFHRFRFTMQNPKWDHLFCQVLYVRRTGTHVISCQLNFPIESVSRLEMPTSLVELNRRIRLFESG